MKNFCDVLNLPGSQESATVFSASNALIGDTLLQNVISGLVDGVLILTDQKKLLYANECAVRILRLLNQREDSLNPIPQEIWHLCQALISSLRLFPNQYWLLESKIVISASISLHIQVKWLKMVAIDQTYLLVVLEDEQQSLKDIAIVEAQKYGLTVREQEIWLLHRSRYTYKQIAVELNITPNTVKKHMKSILAKQKEALGPDY
jgi:DNA-binding CsgD family transcriptional regulator